MRYTLAELGLNENTKNFGKNLLAALHSLPKEEEKIISFPKATYRFSEEDCVCEVYFMTNTVSEAEMAVPERKIGILLKDLKNVSLEGNGSLLLYSDRMTEFVVDNSKNITIKNFVVDFTPASVAEFSVQKRNTFFADILPNAESTYKLDKKFSFDATDIDSKTVMQSCDIKNGITQRVSSMCWNLNPFSRQIKAKKLSNGNIRIYFFGHSFKKSLTYQQVAVRRDACGCFVTECENFNLKNITFHYIHGMGVLCQMSHNITVDCCKMIPNKEKRTTTAFADMIHASMCSGQVRVTNSEFDGSRDDIINVHGNHYIVTKLSKDSCQIKFMHPQTYGFLGVKAGHTVEFLDAYSLMPTCQAVVKKSELSSPRITTLTFDKDLPPCVALGQAVENITMTASLYVDNIVARNIPTRGILVTTRQPVVIENSTFIKTQMHAIHISNDALGWYEGGCVKNAIIRGNTFVECKDFVINVEPENTAHKGAVHSNILVENNTFKMNHDKIVRLKSVDNFVFRKNNIVGSSSPIFEIKNSTNVNIEK